MEIVQAQFSNTKLSYLYIIKNLLYHAFMKKFIDFDLDPDIQRGIDAAGFTDCTPVQEETFTAIFKGHDVTVKSQTGTGKTAAFLISLFQILRNKKHSQESSSQKEQVLIVAPTRELVIQIQEEAELLGAFLNFSFCAVYGGVGYGKQEEQLAQSPDFIVCTPGRLLDFVQNRKIDLKAFGYFVIDEADRMFDMGFYPDIQKILKGMRPQTERRTLLFSATLDTKVLNIAWNFMNNPHDIEIEPEHITVNSITQKLFHVSRDEKFSLLLGIIRKYQPESAIFFTNTKRMAEELSFRLRANDFTAEFIIGDLPQKKRSGIIYALKEKSISFLVATDVAARGLHIDNLGMVFNYDIPEDAENYVHRIGRTARAGNIGIAISFADEQSVYNLAAIEKFIAMKIPVENISSDLLAEDVSRHTRFQSDYSKNRDRGERSDRRPQRQQRNRTHGTRNTQRSAQPTRSAQRGNRQSNYQSNHQRNQQPRGAQWNDYREPYKESRRNNRSHTPRSAPRKPMSGSMTEQERMRYYEQKYGDSFSTGDPGTAAKSAGKRGRSQAGRRGASG